MNTLTTHAAGLSLLLVSQTLLAGLPPAPDFNSSAGLATSQRPPAPDIRAEQSRTLSSGGTGHQVITNQTQTGRTVAKPIPAEKKTEPAALFDFEVKSGWLSDNLEALTKKARYKAAVWEVTDNQGEVIDFSIHTPFVISVAQRLDAFYELTQPFPIRLCFFKTDRVIKVINQNKDCH